MSPRTQAPAPVKLAPLGSRIASRREQVADRPTHLHAVEQEPTPVDAALPQPTPAPGEEPTAPATPEVVTLEAIPVDTPPPDAGSQPDPEPAEDPVAESVVEAQAETVAPTAAEPKAKPTPRSDQSDGGAVRITFAVPVRCIERLRQLAQQGRMTHADVLVTELARLSQVAAPDEPARATVGEFELSAKPVREPLANVGIRLTEKNLKAMDALCERLGVANRSALVAKALS